MDLAWYHLVSEHVSPVTSDAKTEFLTCMSQKTVERYMIRIGSSTFLGGIWGLFVGWLTGAAVDYKWISWMSGAGTVAGNIPPYINWWPN